MEQNDKYFVNSESEFIESSIILMKLEPCIILEVLLNSNDSDPLCSSKLYYYEQECSTVRDC